MVSICFPVSCPLPVLFQTTLPEVSVRSSLTDFTLKQVMVRLHRWSERVGESQGSNSHWEGNGCRAAKPFSTVLGERVYESHLVYLVLNIHGMDVWD